MTVPFPLFWKAIEDSYNFKNSLLDLHFFMVNITGIK